MRRILLLTLVFSIAFGVFAQERVTVSKDVRNHAVLMQKPVVETNNFTQEVLPTAKAFFPPEEEIIGNTYFDLQSNSSMQNRIFVYDDGTIGATFTIGFDFPNFTGDRGTGYNYYDGNAWGDFPTERLEADRTGWCAYSAWGDNGEINVIHYSGAATDGLAFSRRDTKGTGDWTQWDFHAPDPAADYLWPRMATGGVNHNVVHLIGITKPVANGGIVYQGLDGAVLYSRSEDGGTTWSIENELLDGMTSTDYTGFSGDTYEVQSQGDNVAILNGEAWVDLMLLKSTDGGDTWTKTVIWENPYPLWNATPTDTFYTADGAHSLAFDQSGKVHVVFGINRAMSLDGTAQSWFPGVGGIGYWNEDRPTFSNDRDALCPFSDCEYSELIDDYSLIGWMQDVNGSGELDILWDAIPLYYLGASSMPQIVIDDMNQIYVVYSSMTETYDNGTQTYRHLWGRYSNNGDFWGPFVDLSSDLIHIFDECIFPSIATGNDDNIYLVYQQDNEPGLAVRGDEDPYGENFIRFMKIDKTDLKVGVEENNAPIFDYDVAQNAPNPFTGTTTVTVNVREATNLKVEVVNMMGQIVQTIEAGYAMPGMNKITIDGSSLDSGVYFYTVRAGETSISKKMIVE